jgi:adenosylmethionine-8-amino-7-oxononanoate aminotransferase
MGLTLSERDKQVIWHPYTPQKYAPEPIPIAKGEGSLLFDTLGNQYIDAISSWWVTIHGHAHPYIARKIYEQALQLEQVIFAGFTHEPAVQLAERLLDILPGNLTKVFYSDNGSTATEVAIKMAIQYWWNKGNTKRNKIIALNNSYHGDTFGAMSISERGIFTKAFSSYSNVSPDIICLSKGITGGTMALGATACNKKIHDVFIDDDKLKTFFHGHSFTANPIACSAALASLDLLQQKDTIRDIERIVEQHSSFIELLRQKKEALPISNIRQQGTIIAFEVNEQSNNYISNIKEIFIEGSIKKGVYLRPLGNTVYIMPPYCISNAELQKIYAVIIEILSVIP